MSECIEINGSCESRHAWGGHGSGGGLVSEVF